MTSSRNVEEKKIIKNIIRQTGKALVEYNMLHDGDRVLLGLSGGKDSLALLHLLIHFQRVAPIKFKLGAVTIDPQTGTFDPSPLIPYMESLGIEYFFCKEPIMKLAETHMQGDSYCAFCARMKRGTIYATAREKGYNVIALAQHLDDLAESFLMSAFHGGQLKTMKANYTIKEGDLRLIRPLIYVREQQTRHYAEIKNLPIIEENCPACFVMPTQREHMKQLLAGEEKQNEHLFGSLLTAMKPLIAKDTA
jgi:tRNA 2-thiocytidine biosynthesis protein TtcA